MTAQSHPALLPAEGRPAGRHLPARVLRSFVRLEAGEERCLLLFFIYAFLLLVSYYVVRTLREPLLLVAATAEVKIYAAAVAALALMLLVPLYGAAFRRADKNQLVRWVTAFCAATLGALYLAVRSGIDVGFVYYVWAGVFGVTIVAQFWAHAADCFDVTAGRRLFPTIMLGATLGGVAGPSLYRALNDTLDAPELMLVALGLLLSTVPLVSWTRRSVPENRRSRLAVPLERSSDSPFGGLALVARDRYLLLVALLIVLLNCVSTMGDYLLTDFVIERAEQQVANDPALDKGRLIGEFYAGFYLAVNVLTVVLQVLVVGRLFRWIGVSGALLLLPAVALIGYGLVALFPIFGLLRVVKLGECSGNYSVLNTARQALFLPLSTQGKYEGKMATDSFFWRAGDLAPAVIVFVGLSWLGLEARQFAVVNVLLALAWFAVALKLARLDPARAQDATRGRRRRATAAALSAAEGWTRSVPARASAWLAGAAGLIAVTVSLPVEAAPVSAAGARPPGLFDEAAPLEIALVLDSRALCRNPQRAECADLPATLSYRDALGVERRLEVALRTRGRYRADTVQCALPALFVFFTGDSRDTLFAGEKMLPLTTHCTRSAAYEQYLLKEYLAYRIYQALTSKSLHVRLVQVTYVDVRGRAAPIVRYAFFTEHFESFARRHDAAVRPKKLFDPRSGDPAEVTTLDLFQYAIGNTDWSVVQGHNVLLVERADGRVTPVPFDFDFSGLVDAEYASVSPEVQIRSVRQRVFRGVCDPDTDWNAAFALFAARRHEVLRAAREVPGLQPRELTRVVDYLEDAFATFASPDRRQTELVDACRRGQVR